MSESETKSVVFQEDPPGCCVVVYERRRHWRPEIKEEAEAGTSGMGGGGAWHGAGLLEGTQ